jgi:hypothetical protein
MRSTVKYFFLVDILSLDKRIFPWQMSSIWWSDWSYLAFGLIQYMGSEENDTLCQQQCCTFKFSVILMVSGLLI